MTNEEIQFLFSSILNRQANIKEIDLYSTFSYKELENTLLYCDEKFELLRNMSGERFRHIVEYDEDDITNFFSTNKFKVAICLSGHIRNYEKNLESINKYLIKPLNADVFMHTWDSIGSQIKIVQNILGPVPNEENKNLPNLKDIILNLKKIEISNNAEYLNEISKVLDKKSFYLYGQSLGNNFYGGQAEPKFIYSQFYSILRSFKLLEEYMNENNTHYDIVIKLRTDYCLSSGIFIENFELIKNNSVSDIKKIFVPDLPYSNHGHPICCLCKANIEHDEHLEDTCDVFAYSDFNSMKHYMSVYNVLDDIRQHQIKKNTEKLFSNGYTDIQIKDEHKLVDIWKLSNYQLDCFYPERIFNKHLEKFNLCASKLCGIVLR